MTDRAEAMADQPRLLYCSIDSEANDAYRDTYDWNGGIASGNVYASVIYGFHCRNDAGDEWDVPYHFHVKAMTTITMTPTPKCLTHPTPCSTGDLYGRLLDFQPYDADVRAQPDGNEVDTLCSVPSASYWNTFCTGWNAAHDLAGYKPFAYVDWHGDSTTCYYTEIKCRWESVYELYDNMELSVPKSEGYRVAYVGGGDNFKDRATTCIDASDNTYWRIDCTSQRDVTVSAWTKPDKRVVPEYLRPLVDPYEPQPAKDAEGDAEAECDQKGAPCQ